MKFGLILAAMLVFLPALATESKCGVSDNVYDVLAQNMIDKLDLSKGFVNITNKYCYRKDDYFSINMNIVSKDNESSIDGNSIRVSAYSSPFKDYDAVLNSAQKEALDYQLKKLNVEYLTEGTNKEFFVIISPEKVDAEDYAPRCDKLNSVYLSLSGEKYFEEGDNWCQIVVKTDSKSVKNLVQDGVGWINYYGEEIKFRFDGEAKGEFNLGEIKSNLDCKTEMNYDNLESCIVSYREESRVYFSANKEIEDVWVGVNVYGYVNGNGRIRVNIRGKDANVNLEETKSFIKDITTKFFGKDLTPSLESRDDKYERGYTYYFGEAKLINLNLVESALDGLKSDRQQMNTHYSNDEISVTLSEPYLQIYINEQPDEVIDASGSVADEKMMIWPGYFGPTIIITEDKVFTNVVINTKDTELAKQKLSEKVSDYVDIKDWEVKGFVTGAYAYPLMMRAVDSTKGMAMEGGMGVADDVMGESAPNTGPTASRDSENGDTKTMTTTNTNTLMINEPSNQQVGDAFEDEFPEFRNIQKGNEGPLDSLVQHILNIVQKIFSPKTN